MHLPQKLALFALGMGVLFDILFYNASNLGINVFLAEVVFLGGSLLLAKQTKQPLPRHAWIAGGFALAYSAAFAIWTSPFGLAVNMFGFLSTNFLFAAFTLGNQAWFRHPIEILWTGIIDTGYRMLSRIHVLGELKPASTHRYRSILIKSALIGVPILLLFTLLFASADPIFARYADFFLFDWIDTTSFAKIVSHGIFIGFFSLAFLLFFAATYWQRLPNGALKESAASRFESESSIIVGGVVALFGAFLLIQARTLLGGEAAWDATGLTYADYAHQGFAQLVIISLLVLALVLTLRVIHGRYHKTSNTLHAVLLGETYFVLLSAFSRLHLYVDAYGYTPARLFGFWIMALIAVLMGILLVNILRKSDQAHAMQHGLLALGMLCFLFTASAPDALSASLNIQSAKNGGRPVDKEMLFNLSPEAGNIIYAGLGSETPIEGLIYPNPTTYCGPTDGPTSEMSLDMRTRKKIEAWYHKNEPKEIDDTTLKTLGGPSQGWQSWNLSRSLLMNLGVTQSTPNWITDPLNRQEICG